MFEVEDKKVEFKKCSDWAYQVTVHDLLQSKTIPLLLDDRQKTAAEKMLVNVGPTDSFSLFSMRVAGCLLMCMKRN